MRIRRAYRCVLPTLAIILVICAHAACAQEPASGPIKIDQQTFDLHFNFGGEAELDETFERGAARIELSIREIAADTTVTEEQLDRIRMAGYSEKAADARIRLNARRAVIGQEFPDLTAAWSKYHSVLNERSLRRNAKPVMMVVYERTLTDEQRRNHQLFRAKRRDRMARASILHQVAMLGQRIAMTPAQEVALAKLVNKQMPPAALYDDDNIGSVIYYAQSLVPDEDIETLFDAEQLALLKPVLEEGFNVREDLRRNGVLDRISEYRAAVEKAEGGETTASDDDQQQDS
jgi:hypothetical protein